MVNELEKKYNTKIKTAINNNNPYTQVQDLTPKKTSLSTNVNPYNQQSNQLLKPLPKANFEPLVNQAKHTYEGGIVNPLKSLYRTATNLDDASTYSQTKFPSTEGIKEENKSYYQQQTEFDTQRYKAVKDSMESQYDYANMPENTKKAYEEVVNTLLTRQTYGKSFEQQRQNIQSLYEGKEIPDFVQKKLANIDSKETEYNLNVENARQNLVKMAMDNASDVRNLELKYADKDISQATRFTTDILGSIVKMSPYIAVSAITGGVGGATLGAIAGTGTMYAQVYTDSMSKAINEGATREQATEYAHISAMIEAGTEMLSGGIPGAPKGLLSSGIQGKIDDVVKVMVKDGTFRKFISTGVDVFGEGAEEALAEYLGSMALSIYTEDERSDEELTQDMIKAFIMGSVTSATMQMGKYGIIKAAEKFVAEKSTDVQNISLEQANDVMNRIALRTQVENFDGLSYKLEDLPKGNNGYIIDGKTIVLNRNQVEESGLIESALPHEMTHALEKVKGYDKLASFVVNLKAKTLGMDLAQLQQVYQEKFDEVHQQALEMGDTSHQLEIATPDKMARELVAEFIKDNIASRPYKDAQGNIQYDSDGNIITYRNYDALLRLASNQPNMVNKIKKVIRSMIRKSQISEALEFDQTQKADFLIMQEYLESLDGYLNTVLDNADKGLFATEQAQGLQFDTKVLSPNTEQGVKVIRAYESENEQYKGTLEDAQKLLDYSARKGLGFNEVQYEGGTLVRQNNVQLSLDQLKKNDIDVNEVKNVTVEQQEFFKDVSSELLDEQGNLIQLYHGTKNEFNQFELSKGGEFGSGIYLTDNQDTASFYAEYVSKGEQSPKVINVYANIKNPYVITKQDYIKKTENITPNQFKNRLIKQGYDGIIGIGLNGVDRQIVAFYPNQIKETTNLKPTSSPDIRYSLDNSLISQLNLSTLIPLIEQSKQSASDYINSLNIQSDNPNVIKYLETMSNFVRDYNPDLRYDTIGNLTTQAQEDDFNLRENGKLKVYYYDENAINDNAISYGHFLTDNPIGLENPKQVYVKANLVDANGTELSQLDELYEDMTNSDILKQYGSEELLNRVKTELGIDGLQFDGSVMVFSEEQFKDTKIKSTYSEKALSSIKSVSFKKSGNNYIIRSRDFDNKEYTVVLDYEDTIQTFGNDFAKVILGNAKTQEQNYDFVDNIISKPSDKVKQGVFSQERDDHNNQLTEDIVKFNSESSIKRKDGTLKVMYHGSPNRFEEFSYLNLGTTGVQEGKGFYFIDNPLEANKYTNNEEGTIYEVYLNIKKPTNRNKMSISDEQLRKIVLDVHNYDDNGLLYNYADVDREGIESALDEAIDTIKSFADNDVDIIDTILNDSRIDTEQGLRIVNQYTGIDGYTLNTSDGMVSIAFFPEQIKSINNPNPTSDRRIQYSIELDSVKQQQIEQAKLNSTNNFSDARSILNDGTLTTSDSVPLDSVLLNPMYNQAIITKMPTKAQKEQLQAFYLDTLARSGDTVYLELHDGDRVAYLKYPVVSDLDVVNSDIAKFYQDDSQRQEFFKDSKVRDEQGNLIPLYHGTRERFNVFEKEMIGANFNQDEIGFFFTDDLKQAKSYADYNSSGSKRYKEGYVFEVYLNIKKPLVINIDFDPIEYWDRNYKSILKKITQDKYDGIIIKAQKYDSMYIAFDSNQIKETTNLAPTLSPDIRYSIEDERIATRSFQESVLRTELSDKTSETIEKKIADGTFNYVVVEDKQSVDRAIAEIGEDVDKAYNKFKAKIDSGLRMTKDDLVIGQLLIKKLEKSRQTEKVVSLVQDVALLGTELGQQVQALHLIKRMSAEGKLMMMQKTLTRLQDSVNSSKDRNAPRVQLEIPKEYQEFFVEVGARTQELEEQRVQLGQTTEELKTIEREIDSLLLSNVGSEIDTLSRELSELRALEKEESRLFNLVEQLQNRASSLSSEDIDLLQEDARILREQINAKQGSLNEIKQKQAKLSRLESQLAKVQQGESLFLDYSIEENKKQIDEYQSRINEINKQKRKYANLESTLERLSGVDPNVIAELNAKVKVVRKAERLLKKLVKENERFTSKQNVDDVLDEVKSKIAEQLPVTWKDKLDAWRYMSMLGNLRTNVRNVLGNAFVMPMTFSRDILSVGLQQFLPKEQRTRVLRASKEAENFALNDYLTVGKDIMEGTQKYDMKTDIERKRTIFKNRLLEGFREGTFKALEVGDTVFTKKHYITQMAKYLTAQNIDLNTITDEQLENARDFAIKEAEKNTFKQASDLANALNRIERKGGVAGTIVKAVIPFKKTPINILKMGLEYSPLGVLNGIKKIAFDIKSEKVTASQAIDTLSAGLTGTGIALLGATLYGMGFIEIGADDDETKRVYNYKNSLGRQRYSIQIGEGSYSIDWIAPAIMPFIMGAEMMRAFESDTEASLLDSLYDATLDIFDPVFELTMLQGVTDTLQSYAGSGAAMFGETLTTMGSNYINQFVPTLLGQIARTVDPIQRSTLPDAKGSLSSTLETTFRKLGNKIPYVSMMNAPVVDVKGQPISSDENPFMRAFMNLFSPGYYKTDNTTEIDQEILRLYELTENTNVLPKATPKSFQFGGETYKLGNKEYSDFGITMGEESYNLLGKLTRYDLDDETKVKVMDNLYDYAYQLAKDKYLRTQGLENDDASYKKVIEAELKGIPTLDYLIAKYAYSTMSGEDKKETFQKFLDENGFDDDLMEIVGGYKPSSSKLKTKGLKKLK